MDSYENEMKAKASIYDAQLRQQAQCGAAIGSQGLNDAYRPSLQERVKSQLDHASSEYRRVLRLNELAMLLQANPDVARILDLIKDVRQ